MQIKILLFGIILISISGCATYDAATPRRNGYVYSHTQLPQDIKQCILEGSIRIGMTTSQVEASWGQPRDKRQQISALGVTEIWTTYGSGLALGGYGIKNDQSYLRLAEKISFQPHFISSI